MSYLGPILINVTSAILYAFCVRSFIFLSDCVVNYPGLGVNLAIGSQLFGRQCYFVDVLLYQNCTFTPCKLFIDRLMLNGIKIIQEMKRELPNSLANLRAQFPCTFV